MAHFDSTHIPPLSSSLIHLPPSRINEEQGRVYREDAGRRGRWWHSAGWLATAVERPQRRRNGAIAAATAVEKEEGESAERGGEGKGGVRSMAFGDRRRQRKGGGGGEVKRKQGAPAALGLGDRSGRTEGGDGDGGKRRATAVLGGDKGEDEEGEAGGSRRWSSARETEQRGNERR